MIEAISKAVWHNIGAIAAGALLFPTVIFMTPAMLDAGEMAYDRMRPVVVNWVVTDERSEGDDLILSGTMVKQRDCIFLPPTLARDMSSGRNYAVSSAAPTAGKTWAASSDPQSWGPWTVKGGAGKRLMFANVYICGDHRPSAVELGIYIPQQ
jgi:hypothetical protein